MTEPPQSLNSNAQPETDGREPKRKAHKFWAFISYSHADELFAKRLQAALETYRIPKRLVGRVVGGARIPARLFPVFRDREELAGAADLSETIRAQLESSECLIVVCSKNAAQSNWINEEIRFFKALGRSQRVLCIIADSQHDRGTTNEKKVEWFPSALLLKIGPDGQLTRERTEPMAADARPEGDGWRNAKLKLIAGVLGVGFDELRRRDQRRQRMRRVGSAAAAALLQLALAGGYLFLADRGAMLPGAELVRTLLDRHEITWSRQIQDDATVHITATHLRGHVARELLNRWRTAAWTFRVIDPAAQSETQLDVWLAAQSASGALRPGPTRPGTVSVADLVTVFDSAFAPGLLVESGGRIPLGWRLGAYLPSGQQAMGADVAVGGGLWLTAGLAITLSRDDLIQPGQRDEYLQRLARAQRSTQPYYDDDGGWNFFPNQVESEHHSTYASVLALLALLETRAANLPWDRSIEQRDTRLRATAQWLINTFDSSGAASGWRAAPGHSGAVLDGLTLQVYSELLRAEAEVGIALPVGMLRAIGTHVSSLAERTTEYPITSSAFLRQYRRGDGTLAAGTDSMYYAWHPWAIETCVWWIRRLERQNDDHAELVAARRALGHLIVNLGDDMVRAIIDGVAFPIAETSYALAAVGPR